MVKAVFLDFYGTVVHEDGVVIDDIIGRIVPPGSACTKGEVGLYWWRRFVELCAQANGQAFRAQRELEHLSLCQTIGHFGSSEDAWDLSRMMYDFWAKPPLFEDAKFFLNHCPVPIYIVSNIDSRDLCAALAYHRISPAGHVTSEEARAYKPRKELFEYALSKYNLRADEVVHIGDSISSDIAGAEAAGIGAIWLNRTGKPVPDGADTVIATLDAALGTRYFR